MSVNGCLSLCVSRGMSWWLFLSVARLSTVAAKLREKVVEDGWIGLHALYICNTVLGNPGLQVSVFVSDFFESTTERRINLPLTFKIASLVLLNIVTPIIVVLAVLMWELIDLLQVVAVLKFILCFLSFVFCFYLNYFTVIFFQHIYKTQRWKCSILTGINAEKHTDVW